MAFPVELSRDPPAAVGTPAGGEHPGDVLAEPPAPGRGGGLDGNLPPPRVER